jgi:hypothetical protein
MNDVGKDQDALGRVSQLHPGPPPKHNSPSLEILRLQSNDQSTTPT